MKILAPFLVLALSACGASNLSHKDSSSLVVTYYGKEVHRRNTGYISHAGLKDALAKKEKFVVIFSADWCESCQTVKKSLNNAKPKIKNKIYYLNLDEKWVQQLAMIMEIKGIPLMLDIDKSGNTIAMRGGSLPIVSYLMLKY
jgi:thiol:disulfide interchange protein